MKKKQTEKPFVESFAEKSGLNKLKNTNSPRLYYLCGAVTSDPHYRMKFELAEAYLVAKGNLVINPVRYEPDGITWSDALAADVQLLEHLKTMYFSLIQIAGKVNGKTELLLPALALIDPDDRAFPSKGMELETKYGGIILPVVKLSGEWNEILTAAIREAEEGGSDGLAR